MFSSQSVFELQHGELFYCTESRLFLVLQVHRPPENRCLSGRVLYISRTSVLPAVFSIVEKKRVLFWH